MVFRIGQKVVYPNQGIGTIENIAQKSVGETNVSFYTLRLAATNSLVLIPLDNIVNIGLRSPITSRECQSLLDSLAENFEPLSNDWKIRFREFTSNMQTGDIFAVADVMKKLDYLSRHKSLSFREQRMLDKAKYLVISEFATVCAQTENQVEERVNEILTCVCEKHEKLNEANAVSIAA